MILETVNGDRLTIKTASTNQDIIKQEIHEKYSYKIENIFLHWNGFRFIVGLFNGETSVNTIVHQKDVVLKHRDTGGFTDVFLQKEISQMTDKEREEIYKNLDKILEEIFEPFTTA